MISFMCATVFEALSMDHFTALMVTVMAIPAATGAWAAA
jgi:hypothetical protein